MLKHIIKIRLAEFRDDCRASLSLEAMLVLPLLLWAYISAFVFFDAFKTKNTTQKAAYTIADMLSRQTNPVDQDYLDGLNTVFDFLSRSPNPTWLRVTVVTWDSDDEEYEVEWSRTTKNKTEWTTASMDPIEPHIPELSAGDTVIVVETQMRYEPMFRMSLKPFDINNFIVTSPRFAPRLCWEDCAA